MKAGAKLPKTLVMLPPTAAKTVMGTEALGTQDCEELSHQFMGLVADAFAQNGWQIDKQTFSEQSVANEGKLRNLVAFLRERHAQMTREMLSRPKDVTKGKFSLGTDVAELGVGGRADALVLVHIDAVKPPKVMFGPVSADSVGTTVPTLRRRGLWVFPRISLVDAATGEVLCFIDLTDQHQDSLSKALKNVPH